MPDKVIKVEYTIEPSWTIDHYTDVIEIDAADLEGLEGREREDAITKIVEFSVNDNCPWGWNEVT
jgi:hypothetical protein